MGKCNLTLNYICNCGHEVVAKELPPPIKWTDGHVCYFKPNKEVEKLEQERPNHCQRR